MIPLGLSIAVCVRIGQHLGARRYDLIKLSWSVGMSCCLVIQLFSISMFFIAPEFISSIYTSDPELIKMTVSLLGIAAVFQLGDGIQVVGLSALRGIKDTRIPFMATLVSFWVVGAPVAVFVSIGLGYQTWGVWFCVASGLSVAAALHIWRFQRLASAYDN